MSTTEIKIGGLGGQGVILTGIIIGRAASIYDDKCATLTQSFGPEARGSACSAQVIISDQPVAYPYVVRPHVLVVMSQDAADRFIPELRETGILLYEQDLVKPAGVPGSAGAFSIPATRFAEELRRRMVLNIVMTGFFTAVTGLVSPDAMRKSVEVSVPKGTEQLNLEAFERGYEYTRVLASCPPSTGAGLDATASLT